MMTSGFSWPSTTPVCRALYTSLKLIAVGAAPRCLNSEIGIGATGRRILKPFRSAGELIGLLREVISRKPWSQARFRQIMLDFSAWARTKSPRSPSIAGHTSL